MTFNAALVKAVFDDGAITNIVPYGYGVFYQSRISKILAYAIPFGLKIRADGWDRAFHSFTQPVPLCTLSLLRTRWSGVSSSVKS